MSRIITIAIAAIIMTGCGKNHPVDMAKGKQEVKSNFETVQVEKNSISSVVKIPGQLKPFEKVDIYPKVNGFVKEMYVDRGSIVHKGQILMTLEAPEIVQQVQAAQQKLLQAQENINASRDRYFRLKGASKIPGSISDLDLTNSQAKYQADSAQVQSELANLNAIKALEGYLIVKAPFDGVITNRNVSAGAYVGPSGKGSDMPIFTLQQQKKLRLVVSIPEAYTSYLSANSEVSFTVGSLVNQQFKATVSRLAGALDNKLRSEHIEMDVKNDDKKLLPGMVAEVAIPLKANSNAFVVPATAVLNSTQGVYVICVKDNKTTWVPVKSGRTNDGKTEVFGPLTFNDTLIVHASEEVRNGAALIGGVKLK